MKTVVTASSLYICRRILTAIAPRMSWSQQGGYPAGNPALIVGFAAGGAGDIATRIVANYVKEARGVVPGPQILTEHPELFWGIVASMLVANAMLIVLNVPLIWVFVLLLRIPQAMITPLIVLFCFIGAFSMNNSLFDVGVVIGCGFIAYGLRKAGFDLAPLLLAFLLGSLFEENLRQGLILGLGNPLVFLDSPISLTVILFTIAVLVAPLAKTLKTRMAR